MEHFSTSQDEIGGLKVTVLAIKVGADLLGFFPHIQPVNNRKSDHVFFNHFLSIFLFINRQRDDADIRLSELLLLPTKVCKLQITEGSPMSSVEKDNAPFLFQISGDCQTSPSHSRTTHARESVTIIQSHRYLLISRRSIKFLITIPIPYNSHDQGVFGRGSSLSSS